MRITYKKESGLRRTITVDRVLNVLEGPAEAGLNVCVVANTQNEGEIEYVGSGEEGGMLHQWNKQTQQADILLGYVNGKDLLKLLDKWGQMQQAMPGPDAKCRLKL